jgi:chromosome segregation ATPase
MFEESKETTQVQQQGSPRWMGISVVALAAVSLLGVGMGWSASNHIREAQQSASADSKTLRQNLDVLNQRLAQEESTNAQLQGDLSVVTDRMKLTQGELSTARKAADKIRQEDAKQLAEVQDTVNGELATKASTDDVKAVSSGVDGVKSDLNSANEKWSAANGELGTQIARTHDDIEQLRRLGQRDYFEFTLNAKTGKQKVGDVTVELRGTNTKRNQYTVALYVDDMRLEKRNRAVNEPIFFYTKGSRSSLELVVNSVGKDKIAGYLSAPKVQTASNTPAGSGN